MLIQSEDTVKRDVALAAQALDEATHIVTTSHGIISRADVPGLIFDDQGKSILPLNKQQQEKLEEYLRHIQNVKKIRDVLSGDEAIQAESYPVFLRCLLTTLLGVGECHETANAIVVELVRRGFSKLYFLYLTGHLDLVTTRSVYNHVVLLITDASMSGFDSNLKNTLKRNPGIIVDGLLNFSGRTSAYLKHPVVTKYLSRHHFSLNDVVVFNSDGAITPASMIEMKTIAQRHFNRIIQSGLLVPFYRLHTAVILKAMSDDTLNGECGQIIAVTEHGDETTYQVSLSGERVIDASPLQLQRLSQVISLGASVILMGLKAEQYNQQTGVVDSYFKDDKGYERCKVVLDTVLEQKGKAVKSLGVPCHNIRLFHVSLAGEVSSIDRIVDDPFSTASC